MAAQLSFGSPLAQGRTRTRADAPPAPSAPSADAARDVAVADGGDAGAASPCEGASPHLLCADFDGAESRTVSLPRWEGKKMAASDYFVEHAMPNFFFHFTTAYAILRHNGVPVGKRDYLGAISDK